MIYPIDSGGLPGGQIKVLIVEDEGIVALGIMQEVVEIGCYVTGIAASADAALEFVEKEPPHIVLLDIALRGETDGVELGRRIREGYGIPIIFLTGNTDSATKKRALDLGPAAYVSKPYVMGSLGRTIRNVLGIRP